MAKEDLLREFVGEDNFIAELEKFADDDPDAYLAMISNDFDANDQRAVAARPKGIKKVLLEGDRMVARVEFDVDYANPVDEDDRDLSAENVTEHVMDVELLDAHVIELDHSGIGIARGQPFPN